MADKIVQLVDKDNNNIYPVAGALKTGSVNTSTINDGVVTKAKMDFTGFEGNYSYSEIDTGYTWVDGSEIYKKTVHTGALPATAQTITAPHNISNLGTTIRIDGIAIGSVHAARSLPMVSVGSFTGQVAVGVTSTAIELDVAGDRSTYTDSYVTIWYTKSS